MRAALHVRVDPAKQVPLFAQIANAIADQIRGGRLVRGDVLPGSRALAKELRVDRDTVIAAYDDLAAQGFLETVARTGTVVADVPRGASAKRGIASEPAFAVDAGPTVRVAPTLPRGRGVISLAAGVPDVRLVPADLIARAYRRALRRAARGLLSYAGDALGHELLRRALARMVRDARGIAAEEQHVIVTRGSQMALDLVARAIVRPGDVACVEALGYEPAWATFSRAGARLVGVPVDAGGLDVDALERICRRTPVRLLYVTPHHQYPTTVVLTAGRRMQLFALARQYRFAIVEDDYDHEFAYDGRPVLPLASTDAHGSVVYIGTMSKVLAPGLRLGFVVAPCPLIERLARERYLVDRQGDLALELAVAELIDDGELGRHVRKMRRVYGARRDVLAAGLRRLGDRLRFTVPAGGMALWTEVSPALDVERWSRRAAAAGVMFQTGRMYTLGGERLDAARFGYASCSEAELAVALKRLVETAG